MYKDESITGKNLLILFIVLVVLGISYLVWLNSGCNLAGVMTWNGKVCFEELVK